MEGEREGYVNGPAGWGGGQAEGAGRPKMDTSQSAEELAEEQAAGYRGH
jgi:hypothetical protein